MKNHLKKRKVRVKYWSRLSTNNVAHESADNFSLFSKLRQSFSDYYWRRRRCHSFWFELLLTLLHLYQGFLLFSPNYWLPSQISSLASRMTNFSIRLSTLRRRLLSSLDFIIGRVCQTAMTYEEEDDVLPFTDKVNLSFSWPCSRYKPLTSRVLVNREYPPTFLSSTSNCL